MTATTKMANQYLTPTEKAQSAFKARAIELGDANWEGVAGDAWSNSFSVEVHAEYKDDLERWTIALATLNMLVDQQ